MTHEQLKRQVNDFLDQYENQDIAFEIEMGRTEFTDDEGFIKQGRNGTATMTILVNGGATYELER